MATTAPDSTATTELLRRFRAGDSAALNCLLERSTKRLRRLARRMLRCNPDVHRWVQTGDLVQNTLIRFLRALDNVEIESPAHYHNLAAQHLRWELRDLARHYRGPLGLGANHHTDSKKGTGIVGRSKSNDGEPSNMAEWAEFHAAVEQLPSEERQVFELHWYEGLRNQQIAEMLGVTERTVRRYLRSARRMLGDLLPHEQSS